jgi:hypothetical protein
MALPPGEAKISDWETGIFFAQVARPSLERWDNGPWGNSTNKGFYRSLAGPKQKLERVSR